MKIVRTPLLSSNTSDGSSLWLRYTIVRVNEVEDRRSREPCNTITPLMRAYYWAYENSFSNEAFYLNPIVRGIQLFNIMLPIIYIAVLLLVAVFGSPNDAKAETRSDQSLWFMSLSRFSLTSRVKGFIDLQPRFTLDSAGNRRDGNLTTFLTRGAIGYQLTDSIGLYQGYAAVSGYEPERIEHRPFQELFITQNVNSLRLAHRFRLEERFLERTEGISLRSRYFLRAFIPTGVDPSLNFALNEEIFFNLNQREGGPRSGFDQNRLFVGFNYGIAKGVSVDLGYQNQFTRGFGSSDTANHIVLLALFTDFDLMK